MVDEISGESRLDDPVAVVTELIWVEGSDIKTVLGFVRRNGFLDHTEYENPRETGEPYKAVQYWGFNGGAEAELFYLDKKCTKLADIRMSIPVDESFKKEFFNQNDDDETDAFESLLLYGRYRKALLRKFIGALMDDD